MSDLVFGVSMVKDEADIIEATVRHMLDEVDSVIVADNGSTDGTRDVLLTLRGEFAGRMQVIDDVEVGYYQSAKMTALAGRAAESGASWVVPFDADEWWTAVWAPIGDVLRALPTNEGIARATLHDYVTTDLDDPAIACPYDRIQWRRTTPGALPKVAVRAAPGLVIEMGNHGARVPGFDEAPNPVLDVAHFPYRSGEQFVSKVRNGAAAYAATDLPATYGDHWRGYGRILAESGPEVLVNEVYRQWFHEADPEAAGLVLDPVR